MKLTAIERGQRTPSECFAEISTKPSTLREKCIAAGLSQESGGNWRRRHPDSKLSDDEVVALVLKSKQGNWTTAEREALKAMLADGKSGRQCAEALGKSQSQVWRATRRLGITGRGSSPKPNSLRTIGKQHDINWGTLRNRLNRGMTLEEAVSMPVMSRVECGDAAAKARWGKGEDS